jgi:C1A family cysteine protease
MPRQSRVDVYDVDGGLEALRAAIQDHGFAWEAGETPLSAAPPEEQASHLGLVMSDEEIQATAMAIHAASALEAFQAFAAPPAIDWRNNGGNWVTPIKDQDGCGSCVSFATVATIESRIKIVCRNAAMNPDLSEAQVFFCGCGNCCGTGWNFAPALNFCQSTGVALDSAFPYTPNNQPCRSGLTPYVKLTAWTQLLSVADRKNVLATKGPVIGGMEVYQDFYSYRSGVYRHVSGGLVGLHAISVIGYDDAQRCWICKNSWGTAWGDNGFFRIAYGDSGIDTRFAFYDVDLRCPAPSTECERYVPVLREVLLAAQRDPRLRACLRYHVCRRVGRPPVCSRHALFLANQVSQVLARCPQYRASFCRALG